MIMLDTNFLIAVEQPGNEADRQLRVWMAEGERIGVCTLVWTEYLCGPLTPAKQTAADALCRWKEPFQPADAAVAARLFNASGRRRGTLTDCMIAAVAIRCRATFATLNRADFETFVEHGLVLAPVPQRKD
jgi:predicted nucleic acid-binding protein